VSYLYVHDTSDAIPFSRVVKMIWSMLTWGYMRDFMLQILKSLNSYWYLLLLKTPNTTFQAKLNNFFGYNVQSSRSNPLAVIKHALTIGKRGNPPVDPPLFTKAVENTSVHSYLNCICCVFEIYKRKSS
jgi:hypothetical protein